MAAPAHKAKASKKRSPAKRAHKAKAKKRSPAKRARKVSARPTPGKAPVILKTSEAERRKVIKKLMPLLRSGAELNYSDIGEHLKPQRDARCVKKIVDAYLSGKCWGMMGPATEPRHQPLRVKRQVYDLQQRDPGLTTNKQLAKVLDINESTFGGIMGKARKLPAYVEVFSSNILFAEMYMRQFALPTETLVGAVFSLTELGIVRVIIALATTVEVTLILDKTMVLSQYELPRVKELLTAQQQGLKIKLYVQKGSGTQHQKILVVDKLMCSTGSANASWVALRESLEHITYKYDPVEIDRAAEHLKTQIRTLCRPLTPEWLAQQERKLTAEKSAALAKASEGLTGEESLELAVADAFAAEEGGAFVETDRVERRRVVHHRARTKYAAKLKAARRCECGGDLALDDDAHCASCKRKRNFARSTKVLLHQCTDCDSRALKGKTACAKHLELRARHEKNRRATTPLGYCKCSRRASPGHSMCDECRAANNEYSRRVAAKHVAAGECRCGAKLGEIKPASAKYPARAYKLCPACRALARERVRATRAAAKAAEEGFIVAL